MCVKLSALRFEVIFLSKSKDKTETNNETEQVENKDKINKFYEAIDHDADDLRKKMEAEVQQHNDAELEKTKRELEKETRKTVDDGKVKIKINTNRSLSQSEIQHRLDLISKRNLITDSVFESARKKLIDFASTEKYQSLLFDSAKSISSLLKGNDVVLYVREADLQLKDKLISAFGRDCSVKTDKGIEIGGIKAESDQEKRIADDTIDTRLQQQKKWFLQNCGMSIA